MFTAKGYNKIKNKVEDLQLSKHTPQLLSTGASLSRVFITHEAAHQSRALLGTQRVKHTVEYQLRQ